VVADRKALAAAFAALSSTSCPDLSVNRTCVQRIDAVINVTISNAVNASASEVDEVKAVAADWRQKVVDYCSTAGNCTPDQQDQLNNVVVHSPANDTPCTPRNVTGILYPVRDANCTLHIPSVASNSTASISAAARKRQTTDTMTLVVNVLTNPNTQSAPVVTYSVSTSPTDPSSPTVITTTVVDQPSLMDSVSLSTVTPSQTSRPTTGAPMQAAASTMLASLAAVAVALALAL